MLQVLTSMQSPHLTDSKVEGEEPPARNKMTGVNCKQGKRDIIDNTEREQPALNKGM